MIVVAIVFAVLVVAVVAGYAVHKNQDTINADIAKAKDIAASVKSKI